MSDRLTQSAGKICISQTGLADSGVKNNFSFL